MPRSAMYAVRTHKMLDRLSACTHDNDYAAKMGSELLYIICFIYNTCAENENATKVIHAMQTHTCIPIAHTHTQTACM